ncbi:hypothetical protein K388_06927 [Streptomyces sp. KhCrAH-43]|uniref:hypothetical protein n=1 Tax=unclassified Streptomyces TaxID=2593676 RepID=UPI0003693148|nr:MULTISPECIES: hypothetical protein [unclassified Streptomyces]RAJ48661.1 hypothetical protein K388_06927 [Streptomyces sp. KhCrAH-43]
MMADRHAPVQALALTGALLATWEALHPLFDQWFQGGGDAANKGACGQHLVYRDGTPVGREAEGADRTGEPTMTATRLGWTSAARHVASYSAGQVTGTVLLTRVLGYRVPASALIAGAGINALTHLVIDKRQPLLWMAARAGKGGYVDHCTVVRRLDEDGAARVEESGPGTALFELDQALHRAIGAFAAVTTTWLTICSTQKGRTR